MISLLYRRICQYYVLYFDLPADCRVECWRGPIRSTSDLVIVFLLQLPQKSVTKSDCDKYLWIRISNVCHTHETPLKYYSFFFTNHITMHICTFNSPNKLPSNEVSTSSSNSTCFCNTYSIKCLCMSYFYITYTYMS
jgi:hypothetical protein